MRDFDVWLSQFRDSISSYDYYVDFAKVVANAERYRAELHLLNSLIGRHDVEPEFKSLLTRYPSIIAVVPILIAVREHEIYAADNETGGLYRFDRVRHSADEYCVFMRKTGLFEMMSRHLVNNLYDYVLGVETGLDSNGRKNRGVHSWRLFPVSKV